MALIGTFAAVRRRCAHLPEFQTALAYVAEALTPGSFVRARIDALGEGSSHRQELPDGAHAVETAYRTKPRSEGFFESHRRYVDLQVVVSGTECMEVSGAAGLAVAQPYDEAKDLITYADTDEASRLRVREGEAVVFWPEDAHLPSMAVGTPGLVRKIVVKVPARS